MSRTYSDLDPQESEVPVLSSTLSSIYELLVTLLRFTIDTSVRHRQFSRVMTVIYVWDKLEGHAGAARRKQYFFIPGM